jgi:hypothetical protein
LKSTVPKEKVTDINSSMAELMHLVVVSGEDHSKVESLAKVNHRTEGIKMKDGVNDG